MVRVNRESLLKVLESVAPGLSAKESIEQSSCIVFSNGMAMTFNAEVLCARESPIGSIKGAVKAKPLLELLSKLSDDEVEIEQKAKGLVVHSGRNIKASIRMEADVLLPVDQVDVPDEGNWKPLPDNFCDAISIVHSCAGGDDLFVLTCVHITPDYVEACDRLQIARYPIKTPITKSSLVRADSIKKLIGFDVTEINEGDGWLHFRNPTGLRLSFRRMLDDYIALDRFIDSAGTEPITLSGALDEVVARASIFSADNAVGDYLVIDIREDRMVVEGEGSGGRYKERKDIKYKGHPLRFSIAPKLLLAVTEKSNDCRIDENRLFINTDKFSYVTCTVSTKDEEEEAA